MFKRIIIFIFASLLLVSCYNISKPEKPSHLLSKKEMINIIIDLRLLASANGSNQIILKKKGIYSEAYVYEKYKIDSSTFALSNNYYAYHIDDYDEIYNKVRDSLEALNKFYDELLLKEEAEKKKQDSLNRIKKRDSLDIIKKKDSLKLLNVNDSIIDVILKKKKVTPKLIEPVSSTTNQSQ
ncbi:DUF4296 domain-containing protein [Gaetbulibacter sp. M235]|uniref:DUF4296 domain-containing protein n=1 Tax=Gaetbulibacter sp. M235 TaxID=3126510 RepID=UPI00374FC327